VIRIALSFLFAACLSRCLSAQSCDPKTADLRHANLPAAIKNDIVAVLAKDVVKDFGKVLSDASKPSDIALSSCASFPKLAQNGRVILLTPGADYPLETGAGSLGNTDMWLFQQVGDHALLIFRGFGSMLPSNSRAYHNGMLDFDFMFTEPHSDSQNLETYRFNGKRYILHDCRIEDDGPGRPCRK